MTAEERDRIVYAWRIGQDCATMSALISAAIRAAVAEEREVICAGLIDEAGTYEHLYTQEGGQAPEFAFAAKVLRSRAERLREERGQGRQG